MPTILLIRKLQLMSICKKSLLFSQMSKNSCVLGIEEIPIAIQTRFYAGPTSAPGSGAGRGGGAGGSVKESGGGLGKYGAAQEEEYFFHKKREQLEKIKQNMKKKEEKSPELSQNPDK